MVARREGTLRLRLRVTGATTLRRIAPVYMTGVVYLWYANVHLCQFVACRYSWAFSR